MVAVSVSAEIGAHRLLHCTAVGKVYLAALPDGERRTILPRITLTAYTPRTITSRDLLEAELAEVHRPRLVQRAPRVQRRRCLLRRGHP